MDNSPVRITAEETLSDNWYLLKKYSFDLRRRDGSWQAQTREVYDRGNGATILLYNRAQRTVLLISHRPAPYSPNTNSSGSSEHLDTAAIHPQASPSIP